MTKGAQPKWRRHDLRYPPGALVVLAAREAAREPWHDVRSVQNFHRLARMVQRVSARIEHQRSVVRAAVALRRAAILERNVRVARIAVEHRIRVERLVGGRQRW